MKNRDLLNPDLIASIAKLGHTEYFCIADCGLPIPEHLKVIDLSVVAMLPSFLAVLEATLKELVVESYIYAEEISVANPTVEQKMHQLLNGKPSVTLSHDEFKKHVAGARVVVRTGETSPYANVILVGGVNF